MNHTCLNRTFFLCQLYLTRSPRSLVSMPPDPSPLVCLLGNSIWSQRSKRTENHRSWGLNIVKALRMGWPFVLKIMNILALFVLKISGNISEIQVKMPYTLPPPKLSPSLRPCMLRLEVRAVFHFCSFFTCVYARESLHVSFQLFFMK